MDDNRRKQEWRLVGASIRGATHLRKGSPNQDAIKWLPESGTGLPLLLALSDGHGSPRCFRSAEGAQLAVDVGTETMQRLLQGQPDLSNLSAVKTMAEQRMRRELVRAWRKAVEADLAENPLTGDELTHLEGVAGIAARRSVEQDPAIAYGATLMTIIVTEFFILCAQIGDGDILSVSSFGETTRPLAQDEAQLGDETHSLCGPDAWKEIRICLMPLSERPPAMILACTDGYPNSFRSDEDFLEEVAHHLSKIRSCGLEHVSEELPGILEYTSCQASGDDITLAAIKRAEEMDLDTVYRYIVMLESALDRRITRDDLNAHATVDAKSREDLRSELAAGLGEMSKHSQASALEQRARSGDLETAVRGLNQHCHLLSASMARQRRWLLVSLVLALAGIALSLFLLLWPSAPAGDIPKPQPSTVPVVGQTLPEMAVAGATPTPLKGDPRELAAALALTPTALSNLSLRLDSGRSIPLRSGTRLTADQLLGHRAGGVGALIAVVAHTEASPTALLLQNWSTATWTVEVPGCSEVSVEPAAGVELVVGLRIDFGRVEAQVVR